MKVAPRVAAQPPPPAEAAPVRAAVTKPAATPTGAATLDEATARASVEKFFAAFAAHDLKGLDAAYAPNAKFKDDMFDLEKKSSILKMWKGAPPFESFKSEIISVKGNEVHAKWVVDYEMFGNKIHNEIDSRLTLDDQGRITSQREDWDERRWMSQALPVVPKFLQPVAYFFMRPLLNMQMGG
ncbi:MAG: nuclear transport factor 2 family protein [Myxococcaceae bacterium]|nr:nuclear transport factor 2 family protein [Myxococcaceae bacterium]